MYKVSEHESGYICGFSVYKGKTSTELMRQNSTLDPYCTVTINAVMCLLDKHSSSQFLHTEQKIWGDTNDSHLLQRVQSKLFDVNIIEHSLNSVNVRLHLGKTPVTPITS